VALPLLVLAAIVMPPVAMAGCPFAAMLRTGGTGAGASSPLDAVALARASGARQLLAAPSPTVRIMQGPHSLVQRMRQAGSRVTARCALAVGCGLRGRGTCACRGSPPRATK
jgi:hypothetical protein